MSARSHRLAVREARANLAALFALLALLSSTLVGGFVHTDDGCAVERHCHACIFALHHADGATVPKVALPVSHPTELAIPPTPGRLSGEAQFHASRGPPAA